LRVKDEEIHQLSRDLKARDLTIKELAERLSQTAQAAESAASSVYTVEKQRKEALSEVDHLRNELLKVVRKVWLLVLQNA
jgi:methyl-accepting chemotaxis protein